MRVEEFVLDLLDTSGLVFFLLSVSLLADGIGTQTTSCMEQMSRVIDRNPGKSKTRHDHV